MRTNHLTQCPSDLPCDPSPDRGHSPPGACFAWGIVLTLFVLAALALTPHAAEAGSVTYAIQNYAADQNGHTVSGSITTDGKTGLLDTSDITSWTVTIDTTTFRSTDPGSNTAARRSLRNAYGNQNPRIRRIFSRNRSVQPRRSLLDKIPSTSRSLFLFRNGKLGRFMEHVQSGPGRNQPLAPRQRPRAVELHPGRPRRRRPDRRRRLVSPSEGPRDRLRALTPRPARRARGNETDTRLP